MLDPIKGEHDKKCQSIDLPGRQPFTLSFFAYPQLRSLGIESSDGLRNLTLHTCLGTLVCISYTKNKHTQKHIIIVKIIIIAFSKQLLVINDVFYLCLLKLS